MSILDNNGKEIFLSFWKHWSDRETPVDEIMEKLAHPDFVGFGTNYAEFWKNMDEWRAQLVKERQQIIKPFKYDYHWSEARPLAEDMALVCGEIGISLEIDKRKIVLEKVRSSMVLKKVGDSYKMLHWHCSVPDAGASGEVVPGSIRPHRYDETTVLFCDFVDFTTVVTTMPPLVLVEELNDLYEHFDDIMEDNGIERVQTTGDGYLAVCGIVERHDDHAIRCVKAGKDILSFLEERGKTASFKWASRIGIHSGPLTAGVVGKKKFALNVIGDTVNIASRLESTGESGKINVSAYTHELIKDVYACEYRGKIDAKGKGLLDMYWVK